MTETDLSPKTAAIALLARGMTTDAVGKEVGMSGRQVRRWREDPQFEAEIEAARRAILTESVAALTNAVRKAADVALVLLDDKSPAIRVRAVSEVFRALPMLADHANLEARLAALESRLNEREIQTWQAA